MECQNRRNGRTGQQRGYNIVPSFGCSPVSAVLWGNQLTLPELSLGKFPFKKDSSSCNRLYKWIVLPDCTSRTSTFIDCSTVYSAINCETSPIKTNWTPVEQREEPRLLIRVSGVRISDGSPERTHTRQGVRSFYESLGIHARDIPKCPPKTRTSSCQEGISWAARAARCSVRSSNLPNRMLAKWSAVFRCGGRPRFFGLTGIGGQRKTKYRA